MLETILAAGSTPDATLLEKSEAAEVAKLMREAEELRRILFSRLLRWKHQGTA
jgi:hypothetical protein